MPTSSTRYSSEILPDSRLRLAVAASASLCLLLAPALGAMLTPGWRVPAAASVFALTAVELARLLRSQRAARRYRLYGDGAIEVVAADGGLSLASLASGSVLLPGVAWLRIRAAGGRAWGELIAGNPRKNKDWRRLCVILRLSAACYHSPRSQTRSKP